MWCLAETLGRTAGAEFGAVRFALSCYTHEPRRAHKTNIPNSHILPPTTGLQLFLMWQEGAGEEGCWARGRGGCRGGVARNSVRRPNTMFQPQMGHISSPQSTNLLLPSLHTLNVWRGKKRGWGGYMREGATSSPALKNAYFNCPSQLIIINDWGSFFHWVEVESRNKSWGGEMKWKTLWRLQTSDEKKPFKGYKTLSSSTPKHDSEASRTPDAQLWKLEMFAVGLVWVLMSGQFKR